MAFSTYLAIKILDWIVGASAVPAVPSLLALLLFKLNFHHDYYTSAQDGISVLVPEFDN
jgi:hypothetical protein